MSIRSSLSMNYTSNQYWRPYAGLLLICLAAYSPALIFSYALTDDYVYLWSSITGSAHGIGNNFVWSLGRVIWAFFYPFIFQFLGSVEALVWLRIVSLLSVWLTACILFYALHRGGIGKVAAFVGASVFALSPTNGLLISWTAASNIAFANMLAAFAGCLLVHQLSRPRTGMGLLGLTVLHTAFLFAILNIYQTAIGFHTLAVLILTYPQIRTKIRDTIPIATSFVCFTLASFFFMLFYWQWIVPRWGHTMYEEAARIRFDLEKLQQILEQVIYAPLSHWAWSFGTGFGMVLFSIHILLIAGFILSFRSATFREIAFRIVAVLLGAATTIGAISLLSYSPSQALGAVVGFYAFLIGYGLSCISRRLIISGIPIRAYVLFVVFFMPIVSAVVLNQDLIQINRNEYQYLRDRITRETEAEIPSAITFMVSPYVMAAEPPQWIPTQSRALYSSAFAWTIDPIWNLVLLENRSDWLDSWRENPQQTRLYLSPHRQKSAVEIHVFQELEGVAFETVEDHHIGTALEIRDNWYYSDWFGYFQRIDEYWIQHPVLGFFSILHRDGDTLFARSGATDWLLKIADYPNFEIDGIPYRFDLTTYFWGQLLVENLITGEFRAFPFN